MRFQTTSASKLRTVHDGWIIVATGALVLFSCLGLARFAYTMLLPAMQEGLGLPYDPTLAFLAQKIGAVTHSTSLRLFTDLRGHKASGL